MKVMQQTLARKGTVRIRDSEPAVKPGSSKRLSQDHTNTLTGSSQNSPRIVPKLSQAHPEISQEHPKNCSEVSEKMPFTGLAQHDDRRRT